MPEIGKINVDVAFGGIFFVIAEADPLGLRLTPDEGRDIVRISEMIKAAAQAQLPVSRPEDPDFPGISIALLSTSPTGDHADAKNAVTVSTGKLDWERPATWTGVIDRSPCGTGTCAKMATLYARGQLGLNEDYRHEGVLGTVFTGRLIEEINVGDYAAVVPTISDAISVPVIVQDYPPSSGGLKMSPRLLARMAESIDQFRYLKMEDAPSAVKTGKVRELAGDGLGILGGLGGVFFFEELQ